MTVVVSSETEYQEVKDAIGQQLALHGQCLNEMKCSFAAAGTYDVPDLSGAEPAEADDVEPHEALELCCELQDLRGIPRELGLLRARRDPLGISVLRKYPWVSTRFPKQATSYLHAVLEFVSSDDREWLFDRALAEISIENAAEQLHFARHAGRIVPSATQGVACSRRAGCSIARPIRRSRMSCFTPLA